jgi:LysM repeat protein
VYVVAKGDTFSKIATKFGLTIEELQAANPQVKNIDKIKIGDQLTIPEPVSQESAAP